MAWPAPFPGWLLEPGGDAWPRGMTVTPQGAQDPAYRPTPLFLLASPARCFVAGLRGRVNWSVINSTPAIHGLTFHEAFSRSSMNAVSSRWSATLVSSHHQDQNGHPWPCFSRSCPLAGSAALPLPTARSERAFSLHGLASSGVSCAGTELNASLWLGGDNRLRCLSAGSAALLPPYKVGVRSRAELTDRWLNSSCRACR